MSYYTVKVGEDISDVILNSTGSLLNWDAILQANNFTDWTPILSIGQQIFIPDGVNTTLQLQSNVQRILAKYPACNNSQNSLSQVQQNNNNPIIYSGMTFVIEPGQPYILPISAGTLVTRISFRNKGGSSQVKVGLTVGGTEVMPLETFTKFMDIQNPAICNGKNFASSAISLYFTCTYGVSIVRVDLITNYL